MYVLKQAKQDFVFSVTTNEGMCGWSTGKLLLISLFLFIHFSRFQVNTIFQKLNSAVMLCWICLEKWSAAMCFIILRRLFRESLWIWAARHHCPPPAATADGKRELFTTMPLHLISFYLSFSGKGLAPSHPPSTTPAQTTNPVFFFLLSTFIL